MKTELARYVPGHVTNDKHTRHEVGRGGGVTRHNSTMTYPGRAPTTHSEES